MEVKRKKKFGERNKSLDWQSTSMWGRQGLSSMGILVGLMIQWWMMLGAVVVPVESPRVPIKTELILGSTATQPVKPHFHSFGLTRHNCVVSVAGGGGVISLKERRWLRPTHFNECLA